MPQVKRWLDVLLVVVAAPVFLPLIALVATVIRFKMGPPVLYRQKRAGLHGTPFTIYKFRTMVEDPSGTWNPAADNQRLTPLGRSLRRWSLDELPQLWNVLKGDMSWVGPRPLPVSYLPRYNSAQAVRHNVRPGVTGWAQVNGRNATTWAERLRMDAWYVANTSLRLDLQILGRTILGVFYGRGVTSSESVTMQEFQGEQ